MKFTVNHADNQLDKTVVLVSHSLPTVKELCDSAVWIDGGIVKETGNTDAILKLYTGHDL